MEFMQNHTTYITTKRFSTAQSFLLHFVIVTFNSNAVHILKRSQYWREVCSDENRGLDYSEKGTKSTKRSRLT